MSHAAETSLWDELARILRHALQIWGAPKELYEERVLPAAEARRLADWIRALEGMARALVMAVAARLPKPEPSARRAAAPSASTQSTDDLQLGAPPAEGARPRAVAPGSAADLTDAGAPGANALVEPPEPEIPDSAEWTGVVFRMTPGARSGGPGGEGGTRCFLPVRGLAFRLEALLRVAKSPDAYARRLARRLHAGPSLAARLFARPPAKAPRHGPYEELLDEARSLARSALARPAPETG